MTEHDNTLSEPLTVEDIRKIADSLRAVSPTDPEITYYATKELFQEFMGEDAYQEVMDRVQKMEGL
jgi:hypothetical protein